MIFPFKEFHVKIRSILFVSVVLLLVACGRSVTPTISSPTDTVVPATQVPSQTPLPSATPTVTPIPATATPTLTPTPAYPLEGRGPANFAAGIDPLTGLEVSDPTRLDRRPIVIKVENIPREHRPQWGLSLADIVYEYYTELGATRFAAIYYGQDAKQVGPIRSGRFFDANVIQMYKGIFVFGSAYEDVRNSFFRSDFANRLILETTNSCPAVCRYDPNGQNLLMADTASLMSYLQTRKVDNSRQNLDGMFFQAPPPSGGEVAPQVYVRYSGAIYNRWDYDTATGRYLRFSDTQNDVDHKQEVYAQLTDRSNNQPISASNVVMLCVPHRYYVKTADSEVFLIPMDQSAGSYVGCDGKTYQGNMGAAYIARDGQLYPVTWQRTTKDSVLTLLNADGTPFPFKPGQTWFEVLGSYTKITQQDNAWRFTHGMFQ